MHLITHEAFEDRYPARVQPATELPQERSAVFSGDLALSSDTSMRGVVKGKVLVKEGAQLHFHGVIQGSLTVEPGASVYLNGVIKRDLHLAGGAHILGVVKGNVRPKNTGEMHIDGVVKGRVIE